MRKLYVVTGAPSLSDSAHVFTRQTKGPQPMSKIGNQNALTHGGFAELVLLPSEDPKEFEALHASLVAEWNPEGPTEDDKVLSITIGHWRKIRYRRVLKKRLARLAEERSMEREIHQLRMEQLRELVRKLDPDLVDDVTEENLADKVGQGLANKLKEKFPRENYDNDKSWLAAIANHLYDQWDTRLLRERERVPWEEHLSDGEAAKYEQEFEERVDGKIDRDIKQLGQIKTMKAIGIGRRSAPVTIEPVKQIQSPPIQVAECEENKT